MRTDDSKQYFKPRPIISSRLPKAFSQPFKHLPVLVHESQDPETTKESKLQNRLLTPMKVDTPSVQIATTRRNAQYKIRRFSNFHKKLKIPTQFRKLQSYHDINLPPIGKTHLEHMVTLGLLTKNSLHGTIRKVVDASTFKLYAIKEKPMLSKDSRQALVKIVKEWQELQSSSKYLVKINSQHWNSPEGFTSLVMEMMPNGSLAELVDYVGAVPEIVLQSIARSVLAGLNHLHENKHCYHKLNAGNVLFDLDYRVKLSLSFGQSDSDSNASNIYELGMLVLGTFLGSFEMFDIQSTQDCCYFHALKTSSGYPIFKRMSPELESFLCACLKQSPQERSDARSLLSHSWMLKIKFEGAQVSLGELLGVTTLPLSQQESEQKLEKLCSALTVVMLGQTPPIQSRYVEKLAKDLGLSYSFVRDKLNHVMYNNQYIQVWQYGEFVNEVN